MNPAKGKGAFALQHGQSFFDFPAECSLGSGSSISFRLERRKQPIHGISHEVFPRAGGREWGSNPPRAGLRPLPDLKSGRPTGGVSLPCPCFLATEATAIGGANKSKRAGLIRRKSPRRNVTPWRSKNSRI